MCGALDLWENFKYIGSTITSDYLKVKQYSKFWETNVIS